MTYKQQFGADFLSNVSLFIIHYSLFIIRYSLFGNGGNCKWLVDAGLIRQG
nr:hypothetical protein [Moritella viscosa]SHN99319.1 Putative uncharacterized protein [Moritella viscosa]